MDKLDLPETEPYQPEDEVSSRHKETNDMHAEEPTSSETEKNENMENIKDETIQDKQASAQDPSEILEEEVRTSEEGAPENEQLRQANQELKDKYLRLFAEFDNYKKRTIREKVELMNTAAQDTMSALLDVLDDFDRAKEIADDEKTEESLSEGVRLVYHKLYHVLSQKGLKPMESTGQPFDPELHEAISEIPAPQPDQKGKVVDTITKGYTLNDRIIRHAKVVVGK